MTDNGLVLITGAAGWLGRRVVRALTTGHPEMGRPERVAAPSACWFVPARTSMTCWRSEPRRSKATFAILKAARALAAGATGATLIHLAGIIHPTRGTREFTEVNVEGTKNIVRAAGKAGVARAVVMSSNSPIGVSRNPFEVFDEDSPYKPYMGYGRSKQEMEEWLRAGANGESLPGITVIRAPWFYGPEQPLRQTRFFSMIKAGRFPIVGGGHNRRSMGYVDSLAYGILLAAREPQAIGRTYWLADERPYPMREIVDTVREVLRDDFGMPVKSKTVEGARCCFRRGEARRLGPAESWTLQSGNPRSVGNEPDHRVHD